MKDFLVLERPQILQVFRKKIEICTVKILSKINRWICSEESTNGVAATYIYRISKCIAVEDMFRFVFYFWIGFFLFFKSLVLNSFEIEKKIN